MTTKGDFTEEEWNELLKAPMTAGVLVITADPHLTSIFGEMKGMLDGMLKQPIPEGAQELVGDLLQDSKAKAENREKMEQPDTKGKDPEQVVTELLDQLRGVTALLDEKCAEDEAAGFKQWLMGVAETTAEAGREGGFLGIGAVRVSEKEKAIMEKISQTLGLN
jgi:hypothetical protein